MSKVSVIMPAFNNAQFVAEAVRSVLNQDFDDFELIIVDDGSTDNTREIISQYSDRRIVKFFLPDNVGVSCARNKGIELATGKFICFLDSDDLMLPDNLEIKFKLAESQKAKLIFSDYYKADSINDFVNIENLTPYLRKSHFFDLIKNYQIPASGKREHYYRISKSDALGFFIRNMGININTVFIDACFMKKEVKEYFNPRLKIAEDLNLWWHLLFSEHLDELFYVDMPLAVYRYYNAKWVSAPMRECHIYAYYKQIIPSLYKYRQVIGKKFLSEALWEVSWQFNKNIQYRVYFIMRALLLFPAKFKYWKSFVFQLLKVSFQMLKNILLSLGRKYV